MLTHQGVNIFARLPKLLSLPLLVLQDESVEIGLELNFLVNPLFLLEVPALLPRNPQLYRNVVPKVELLLLGQTAGILYVFDGFV